MKEKFKNLYLAKSHPQETIQEHTDKLLKNLEILKKIYPNLFINWDILYMLEKSCLYHDLGKMNLSFQQKIMGGKEEQLLPHGFFSLCFLEADNLFDEIFKKYLEDGLKENEAEEKTIICIKVIANSIAYHHERDIPQNPDKIILDNLDNLNEQLKNFKYDKIKINQVEEISSEFFSFGQRPMPAYKNDIDYKIKNEVFNKYILIKGLLNRIDYSASAGKDIEVEKKNDFLLNKLNEMLNNWKKKNINISWNKLQEFMIKNRDENVISIAQTGMGKTEAGLLWIGNNKGFFILPLKTAINSIYNRIKDNIIKDNIENRIGLLHSETKDIYLKDYSDDNFDLYYESTKQLSLPLTICTLDQIFDFVYRYKGFESKLATLSYSKIVLDEIQMYSSDLLAYIIKGLKYITKFGGKFAILTATFPKIIEDFLKKENIKFLVSKNFIKSELNLRHKCEIIKETINSKFILSKYKKNKILVICNTIKEAQRIYSELLNLEVTKVNLFHSKFIKRDRKIKEKNILTLGNKVNKEYGIWITTQIVEASLDIDFDILITELSDLNGLFQRMGRCYRNRPLENNLTNCFVFVGKENKKNTGIGFVIDEDIYNLSKKIVCEKLNGLVYEENKMKYVSELYTTENLKNTKYYKKVEDTLKYLDMINPYEKNKSEVRKEFRDITSYNIIPRNVYEENIDFINKNLNILDKDYSLLKSENEILNLKKEKIKAKINIRELTLNLQGYELKIKNFSNFKSIKLSKYEEIYIIDCEYNFEMGFKVKNQSEINIVEERYL